MCCFVVVLIVVLLPRRVLCSEAENGKEKKAEGKVDMVVALINAVYLIEQDMLFGSDGFIIQT